MPSQKPKVAVYKFSSCDGCQLQLLNLENELLDLLGAVEIAYFLEARRRVLPPPYDIGLVEGSISTADEEERIQQVRRDCKYLVAIGACATSGGIQALRNWANVEDYIQCVYAKREYISTLETASPIASHVFVDFEFRGCPINQYQLLELVSALLTGRKPNVPTHSVCIECKRQGTFLRPGVARKTVPGADHPSRLRSAVSGVRSGMLRLFRTDGATQYYISGTLVHRSTGAQQPRHETYAAIIQRISGTV